MTDTSIEVADQQTAFTYVLCALAARSTGRENSALYALTQPGIRGLALFCAARGDTAEEAATLLGIEVRGLERAIRQRVHADT